MVYGDVQPALLLLLVLPVFAIRSGLAGIFRAVAAVLLSQLGPMVMLAMGAWLYGRGQTYGYLWIIQLIAGVLGVVAVVKLTRPLRASISIWVFAVFFSGIAVTSVFALFVGGMALYNDWL